MSVDLTPHEAHPWVSEGQDRIRFGISIYPQSQDWQHHIAIVQKMETQGYDAYYAYDHPEANTDCWTSLAALAASTSTIRLGTMVDCIYYRSPYMLARQAADVDRLSGGRLLLGLGIGDNVPEFEQMGIPFPPTKTRLQGMEETIRILRGLWSESPFTFEGEQWSVSSTADFAPPMQKPYVPIVLAGGGEKVTLRQVAQYADASNMGAHGWIGGAVTTEDVQRKFGKLREYCEKFNRPYESVLRSQFTMPLVLERDRPALERKLAGMPQDVLEWCGDALFAGTPTEAIGFYQSLAKVGFQYFVANILDGDESTIDLLASEVMPAFR